MNKKHYKMSDADQKHSSSHGGHFTASHPCSASKCSVPSNVVLDHTSATTLSVPPFAPQPGIGQQIGDPVSSVTRSTATPPVSSSDCNIHEFCYYFQQFIFISAIMTGSALVVAGAVMHAQNGELLVFVYIGVLLVGVNTVLLMIQCYVRRKQKKRARAYSAGRRPQDNRAVHYSVLSTNPPVSVPVSHTQPTTLTFDGNSRYPYHHRIHSDVPHPMYGDWRGPQQYGVKTSVETGPHGHYMLPIPTSQAPPTFRSRSVMSNTRYTKENFPHSPPLNQHSSHRPIVTPQGSQLPTPRSDCMPFDSYTPSGPPPSYNELLHSGRLPQDGTTVHIL
ncbi:uncharacterized protein LOC106457931 isoform X1 [Limulus polyphemus]|uniref:Uncharacterized protein LOC106457931 isoform X1 n=2 Tax=Limulus polyphemus TaxID=6850 RepID=A0ABM1S7W7_LIMPO|nr:uncharacterized protein LOC106457931 isoform X1 [Limulus polyphemus]